MDRDEEPTVSKAPESQAICTRLRPGYLSVGDSSGRSGEIVKSSISAFQCYYRYDYHYCYYYHYYYYHHYYIIMQRQQVNLLL